jgi:diketogulonate reductase-like aldo/keto reductase
MSVAVTSITAAVRLSDGVIMPRFGLGVYRAESGNETYQAVLDALKAGYRHIDTAALYDNEGDVGRAIRDSGIPRDSIFVTTKVWNSDQGYEQTLAACRNSLNLLGMEYVDLYLIHSPVQGKRLDTWRAMEQLLKEGKARSIGVSNYGIHHLKELFAACKVRPTVNQIELSVCC